MWDPLHQVPGQGHVATDMGGDRQALSGATSQLPCFQTASSGCTCVPMRVQLQSCPFVMPFCRPVSRRRALLRMMPSWPPATPPDKGRALAHCSCLCDPQDTGRFHDQSFETMQRNGGVTPPLGGQGPPLTSPPQGSIRYPPTVVRPTTRRKRWSIARLAGCQHHPPSCGARALAQMAAKAEWLDDPVEWGKWSTMVGLKAPARIHHPWGRASTEPPGGGGRKGTQNALQNRGTLCTSFPLPISLFGIPDRSSFRASSLFFFPPTQKIKEGCVKLRLLFVF